MLNFTEHLLVKIAEEGTEIAQAADKAILFGLEDRYKRAYQNTDSPAPSTREKLIDELNDLLGVANMLVDHGVLPPDWSSKEKQIAKKNKILKYMAYAQSRGTLEDPIRYET